MSRHETHAIGLVGTDHFGRPVRRTVINHDHLDRSVSLGQHAFYRSADIAFSVEARQTDRDERITHASTLRPCTSPSSRNAKRPPSELNSALWNSSLTRRSKSTRKSPVPLSPDGHAIKSAFTLDYDTSISALFIRNVKIFFPRLSGKYGINGPAMRCTSVGNGVGNRTAAWCVSSVGGDVSCAMVRGGWALRWDRHWRGHMCER